MGSLLAPDNCVSWFLLNPLLRLAKSFLGIGHAFLAECYLLVHSLIIEAHYWLSLFHHFLSLRHPLAASTLTLAVNALAVAAIAGFDLNWLTTLAVRALAICATTTTLFGCLNQWFCLWLVNLYLIGLWLLICILTAVTIHTVA